jgi:small ligand-binding sensory domain FIST
MATRLASIRVGAGISTRRSGLAAAEDALGAALAPLEGAIPDLAFLFVAPQFEDELESIVESANASLGGGTLIGCVAGGVIGGAREVEDAPAVSAWAATLPGVKVRPFILTYAEEEEHGVFDGLEEVPTRAPDSVLVMLADPYTFPAHLLLDHLNEHAPGLPVVGGMASGGIVAGRTRLIADDEIVTEGAIGAILEGAYGATAVVSQGCRPVGSPFTVTKSDRNVVLELGGRSAITRLAELVAAADDRDRALLSRGLHVGIVVDEHRVDFDRGDFLVRSVLGADQSTGAVMVGERVDVGQTIQFQVRDAEAADDDLTALLAGIDDARAALLFTCNGRGVHLFGHPDHDTALIEERLGPVPLAGAFCAGEIGPIGGRNFLHGFTASIALFSDAPT